MTGSIEELDNRIPSAGNGVTMTERTWVETTRFRPDDLCRFTLASDRNPIEGRVHEFVTYDGELGLVVQTGVATFAEIPMEEIRVIEVAE